MPSVAIPPPPIATLYAGRRCGGLARSLALGFAGAVAMWAVAYVAMMTPGALLDGFIGGATASSKEKAHFATQIVGELLFGATMACAFGAGFISGAHRMPMERGLRGGSIAGAKTGFVIATINMLLIGSLIGESLRGESDGAVMRTAALWFFGNYLVTIALAAAGGGVAAGRDGGRDNTRPWKNWFSPFTRVAAVTVFLLLITGGLVTGLEAGLAVPDWPGSFGHNMLLYPLSQMTGGIFYEHAHRLYGMLVGFTALTLAVAAFWFDERRWVRTLGVVFLLMVSGQGILGGTRVTETNLTLAIIHGAFAQIVFATACAIAVVTKTPWRWRREPALSTASSTDRTWSTLLVAALVLQLILGAMYRHTLSAHVLYTHILWALFVMGLITFVAGRAWRGNPDAKGDDARLLSRLGKVTLRTAGVQVLLGVVAMIAVLSRPSAPPTNPGEATPIGTVPLWEILFTTAHQVTGALLLGLATMLMLWTRRVLPGESRSLSLAA